MAEMGARIVAHPGSQGGRAAPRPAARTRVSSTSRVRSAGEPRLVRLDGRGAVRRDPGRDPAQAAQGRQLLAPAGQRAASVSASLRTASAPPRGLARSAAQDRRSPGRRGDLREAGEPERVRPRLADRPGPGVLRAGRGPLAREPVAGVEAPQPAVAVHPRVRVRDRDRRPLVVGPRPDAEPVAAGVVDERHAHRPPDAAGEVARIGLVEGVAPDPPEEVERPAQVPLAGERQPHDVLAALEVDRVRAGARVDDRVAVDRPRAAGRPSGGGGRRPSRRGPRRRTRPAASCRPSSSSRTTKHCSQSASWSLAPSNVERQSFIA